MINIVKHRWWFIGLSLLIIVPGVAALGAFGLKQGIDFTGGSAWQVRFEQPVAVEQVRAALRQAGETGAAVQSVGEQAANGRSREVAIRLGPELQQNTPAKAALERALRERVGPYTEQQFQNVGPAVGSEIAQRSVLAVAIMSVAILLYLAFAFRKVRHPFRYGACAIIAMLHDVLVVLGIYAVLGRLFNIEVDALFVTAMLTVIGFSVHDTIVVFDRIRENQLRRVGERFEDVVNYSLVQTLVRSINTSITVLLTLSALYLFGGVTIRNFVLALLIGIASGTFSSIFNASMLLVIWENGEWGRFIGRRPRRAVATPA